MATTMVSAQRLREVLHYKPETGVFTRRIRTSNSVKVGDVAGTRLPNGYRNVMVDRRFYQAHRLAWFYVTGAWPTGEIDHRDGHRDNNAFANLRDGTHRQNAQNRRTANINKRSCALLGVSPHGKRWQARICSYGKGVHLGSYDTAEEAHAVYVEAKRRQHEFCTL